MRSLNIIFYLFYQVLLFSQPCDNHQYFYNKVLDQITLNDGFLLSCNTNVFIFKDKKISKMEIVDLLPTKYKNINIDTVNTFTFPENLIILNQANIIQLPFDFQPILSLENQEYSKIFLSNAFRVVHNDTTGFLIIFRKESMIGFDFTFDSKGLVLGWINNDGMFYNFEYFDNLFKGDPNIKLIEIEK